MSYTEIKEITSKIIDLEQDLNNLIEEVSNDSISYSNNKEEIEHELIVASRAISRAYTLLMDNIEGDQEMRWAEEDLTNCLDKGGKLI